MVRHLVPPSNTPRLTSVLGPGAVELRIAGALVTTDKHTALGIRRAKGARDHVGQPAALSVSVNVDTPPTWRKGDKVTVQLGAGALTSLYGPQYVRSNYVSNPSFEVDTSGWTTVAGGGAITRVTTTPRHGAGVGRYTFSAAKSVGVDLFYVNAATTVAKAGDRWTGRLAMRSAGTSAGGLYRVELRAMSGTVSLGVIARADVALGSAWTDFTIPSIATAPAGTDRLRLYFASRDEFTSGNAVDLDAVMVDNTPTPPTQYADGSLAAYVGTDGRQVLYAWEGTANASASHEYVTGVPTAWAEARYRFVGRLADVQLRTGRTGPATAQLVATGTTAQLGTTDVGDTPWPAELASTRAARVLALAQAQDPTLSYTMLPASDGPSMAPRDVDSQPAARLLEELGEAIGPLASLVEKRDGSLAFGNVGAATFPAVWLTEQVTPSRLEHPSAPRINTVAVDLGVPPLGTVLRENVVPNPGFEVDTTSWTAVNGATLARDTVTLNTGVATGKFTPATTANPGGYTSWVVTPGQRWRILTRILAAVAGTYRVQFAYYDAATTLLGQESFDTALPALGWVDVDVTTAAAGAPAGTTAARLYIFRLDATVTAAKTHNIDRLAAFDLAVPGAATAAYFDGSTAAAENVSYAWVGTAGKSASRQLATDRASQVVLTSTDAASVAAFGPYAAKVEAAVSWATPAAAYAYGQARGVAEYLAGGWQAPQVAVDVLALLTDRTDPVTATPAGATKLAIAQALMRAELGSSRTLRYVTGDPAHVPPLHNVTAPITALDESITAHSWTVTTESERTT